MASSHVIDEVLDEAAHSHPPFIGGRENSVIVAMMRELRGNPLAALKESLELNNFSRSPLVAALRIHFIVRPAQDIQIRFPREYAPEGQEGLPSCVVLRSLNESLPRTPDDAVHHKREAPRILSGWRKVFVVCRVRRPDGCQV